MIEPFFYSKSTRHLNTILWCTSRHFLQWVGKKCRAIQIKMLRFILSGRVLMMMMLLLWSERYSYKFSISTIYITIPDWMMLFEKWHQQRDTNIYTEETHTRTIIHTLCPAMIQFHISELTFVNPTRNKQFLSHQYRARRGKWKQKLHSINKVDANSFECERMSERGSVCVFRHRKSDCKSQRDRC